jgi:hypothetical protein
MIRNGTRAICSMRLLTPVLTIAFLMLISSCERLDFPIKPPPPKTYNDTVRVTIFMGETYTDTIAAFSPVCLSQVKTDATHAKVSNLTMDIDRNAMYQYTPAANFFGTDAVTITMTGGQHHSSNMVMDGTQTINTTFLITVVGQ